jgi:hypothetical protein
MARSAFTDGQRLFALEPSATFVDLVRARRSEMLRAIAALREEVSALPSAVEAVLRDHWSGNRHPSRYHLLYATWLRPGVGYDELARAWAALQITHPVLRARFTWEAQARAPKAWVTQRLGVLQRRALGNQQASALTELLAQLGSEPFDLEREPPARLHFIEAADSARAAAVIVAHHCITDYIGLTRLLSELDHELSAEPPRPIKAGALGWARRRQSEDEFVRSSAGEALRNEYRSIGPRLDTPTRPPAAGQHSEEWWLRRAWPSGVGAHAIATGDSAGAILLAALAAVMRSRLSRDSVLCGVNVAMGDSARIDMQVNTVPVCLEVRAETRLCELLRAAGDHWRTLRERASYPYTSALRDINEQSRRRFVVPDVMLSWRGREGLLLPSGGVLGDRIPSLPQRGPWHELAVDIVQVGTTLEVHWSYEPHLHGRADVEAYAERFAALVERLCDGERGVPVGQLIALPAASAPESPSNRPRAAGLGSAEELEARLCDVLRAQLGADVCGESSLFDYPNASQNILRLKAEIDANDEFPLAVFFDAPNVRALARSLSGREEGLWASQGDAPGRSSAGRLLRRRARAKT